MASDDTSIETVYRRRADAAAAAEKHDAVWEKALAHVRLAVFAAAVALFVLGSKRGQGGLWYGAGGAGVGFFFAAVVYHEHVRRQIERNRLLRQINQQAIARLHRNWAGLPDRSVAVPARRRALADDLDLFGPASLFHFLCSANTPVGITTLRDWLLEPASCKEVQRRQQAVAELAPTPSAR